MNKSIWTDASARPKFEKLKSDKKTDVLIVGGGIAGILCAYQLSKAGVDYMLVEASQICSGITENTTAKITSQHGLVYTKLAKQLGLEQAKMYLQANQAAIRAYELLSKEFPCDFEEKDAFVYSLKDRQTLEEECETLSKMGFTADLGTALPLPFPVVGAVKFCKQAQFHPLKFLYSIAQGLNIYENTPVREFTGTTAITDTCKIQADKIIMATHFPIINKHGMYFLKLYQQRSYVLALENAQDVGGMYIDAAKNGLSLRNHGDLLLLGGGGHRTGKQGGNWAELKNFAQRYYRGANVIRQWATQDCMSLDGVPYIGQYSKSTPELYVATGFNKWGMTSAMAASMILGDLVQDKDNPYASLFSPSRHMLRPQLAVNGWEATTNMLSFTKKRCPHLGCALKWNQAEHSWDCPCHGSRFTENGKLIDNPATGDLKQK